MLHQIIQNQPHDIDERVKCPKCAEWIRFEAKMCPHCKSEDDEWKRGMVRAIKTREEAVIQGRESFLRIVRIVLIVTVLILVIIFLSSFFRR